MSLSPFPTVKNTGQESGAELCRIFKFWSFPRSKRVNSVCKLLQLLGTESPHTHRRQSIGVHGVRTPQFLAVWCPHVGGRAASDCCTHWQISVSWMFSVNKGDLVQGRRNRGDTGDMYPPLTTKGDITCTCTPYSHEVNRLFWPFV